VTHEIKSDTAIISKNTTLIREYTCGIAKQLEKQDEILRQIAWLRAVVLHKSVVNQDRAFLMEKYFDSLTDYASSVCGDSVSEDVAREMNLLSLGNSGTSTPFIEADPSTSLETTKSMTLVVGNTHRLVTPPRPYSESRHMWTFYIRVSDPERVEEVRMRLVSDSLPPFD
jgi:hypothetical protein